MEQDNTIKAGPGGQMESGDEAQKSLMDGLRVLFWVLKLAMLALVVLYLASGIKQINQNEVGLKVRFGKIVKSAETAEAGPGFKWALPWPIDQWIVIPKGTQRGVNVEFQYQMTEQEKVQGPSPFAGGSLVPGKDNFVLTGDGNIIHVLVRVNYRIADAAEYVENIMDAGVEGKPGELRMPEKGLVEALAREAIIQAAGQFEVDQLLTRSQVFSDRVEKYLQESLRELRAGLTLDDVLVREITPPRQVQAHFNDVRNAADEKGAMVKSAEGEAVKLLTETAGTGYEELIAAIEEEEGLRSSGGDGVEEAKLRIASLLDQGQGEVQSILSDAKVYRTQIEASAKADAEYFEALLPEVRANQQVVLTRLLLSTLEDLFPQVEKWYVPTRVDQVRIMVDKDPRDLQKKPTQQSQNR